MSPPSLLDPPASPSAPPQYRVHLDTTAGLITIEVERALAPRGADRFYELVQRGFYDGVAIFRVVPGFVAQFGLHGDPRVNKVWRDARIPDDPVRAKNERGTICFATSGKDARTTQVFLSLRDNSRLDAMGFAPFGRVQDLSVAERFYSEYGEGPPGGQGPHQSRIVKEGDAYLSPNFPKLDRIRSARLG